MQWWEQAARRIRVPLGFLAAALYLLEIARRAPRPAALAWSLALVLPGLLLRGYASGYVKKNRELTTTGPYAYTRNPLYLGSMLMAAGFAIALLSWLVATVLIAGFALVYIPVIASEEGYLGEHFAHFAAYCRAVPRIIPRLTPARLSAEKPPAGLAVQEQLAGLPAAQPAADAGTGPPADSPGFSLALYRKHREYNALLGAALLYLSLLALRPALAALVPGLVSRAQ
jgi:protein-S-isoprenylcysteine O-methyltransferase Ste14